MSTLCPYCLVEHELSSKEGTKICEIDPKPFNRKRGNEWVVPNPYISYVGEGVPVYPIVFIGRKGVGKTHFLVGMINMLREIKAATTMPTRSPQPREVLSNDDANKVTATLSEKYFRWLDTDSQQYYNEYWRLSQNRDVAGKWEGTQQIHVFLGAIGSRTIGLVKKRRIPRAILIVYDLPGEYFMEPGFDKSVDWELSIDFKVIKYIPNVFLMIDSTGIFPVYFRRRPKPNYFANDKLRDKHLSDLLSFFRMDLEKDANSPNNKKNLFVCFTKCDAVWALKEDQSERGEGDVDNAMSSPFVSRPAKRVSLVGDGIIQEIEAQSNTLAAHVAERWPLTHLELSMFGGVSLFQTSYYGVAPRIDESGKETLAAGGGPIGFLDPLAALLHSGRG